ncbi:MAG: alanine--tRNA ligase [Gammaproteobacteria bacterium]|nr:alanine--tRNA ligase [Gammaproteobacteria bacterium]MDE0365643.1 alanine--tRNA ligase [Gammaproteobacteria bacterium]
MKAAEIRRAYLAFFEAAGHRVVPSSSLVPYNDPTLLFTNAGMNQFKDALLGREDPGYRRAASSQKCVRAGGKHNDLENVGYTARHLTFFEMLGNFSFGDYFKEEAIDWAWEFVTEGFGLPRDRLWVTVHPTDDESRALWTRKIGIPAERVVDHETNFWTMGDTGPCGPCTELFYDHGPAVAGGPPGTPDEEGDRYVEFWNLVFPQFDRSADGDLKPLPQPGVDTGMGLERMATVLQGVHSNYEIDLFRRLMLRAGRLAGLTDEAQVLGNPSVRVIADHLRSSAFLIADGVMPGNEDRDYVLRRIIRRALRHGYKLNIREPFFHLLVDDLVAEMGAAFPQLRDKQPEVRAALEQEEERFERTLSRGMELLEKTIRGLRDTEIPGDVVFKLYDTFGFPTDLTEDIARERGLSADMAGFEEAMERQRDQGRASTRFDFALGQKIHTESRVDFLGYETVSETGEVRGLYDAEGNPLETLEAGQDGVVVLNRTPFYAEAGGQVGDAGLLESEGLRFEVQDTQRSGEQHLHIGSVTAGRLESGARLQATVDASRRRLIMANHSATHLLHAALRKVLGPHVSQMGSLVDAEHLRFDFSHGQPVTTGELADIEALVNKQVFANTDVGVARTSYDEAIEQGAIALFGEKYGDDVRVLTMGGDWSVELCGGTHVRRTGDIGLCRITAESGIAQGVRRIEAVTGMAALKRVSQVDSLVQHLADTLKSIPQNLEDRVASLVEENRRLAREVKELTQRLASGFGSDLVDGAQDINGINVVAAKIEGDAKAMMQTLDLLKSRLNPVVILLAQENKGKVNLVAGVSNDLTERMQAPELIKVVGAIVGARGGGSPVLARAGGGDAPEKLGDAMAMVAEWVRERSGGTS